MADIITETFYRWTSSIPTLTYAFWLLFLVYISLPLGVLHLVYNKFGKGLAHIPGPHLAGYSRLWRFWKVWDGQVMRLGKSSHAACVDAADVSADTELHAKYGPLVRIGPCNVLVSDSEASKIIYSPSSGFDKTDFYWVQSPLVEGKIVPDTMFNLQNESQHARLKRVLSSTYSVNSLKAMESLVDEISDQFIDVLNQRFARTGKVLDLGEWIQWYAFDVIGNLTFSKPFGFLETGEDIESSIEQIAKFLQYSALVGQMPELHYLLLANPILLKLSNSSHHVVQFTERAIKERDGHTFTAKDSLDFLGVMRKLAIEKPGQFSQKDVFLSTAANVFAGSDTTAIAFRSTIYNLLTHPHCLSKLRNEIDCALEEKRLSKKAAMSEVSNLTYLQACIKEAMRLHPSVAMPLERVVPRGGTELCGRYIPGGTIVGVNPWVAGRDPAIYGSDALTFRPERWIEASEEQLRAMERNFLAFGAGSRICLGRHISLMEISKVIPRLLINFNMSLADPRTQLKVTTYWFAMQEGLICKLKPRNGE